MTPSDVSVAIPSYRREQVLLATVEAVLIQQPGELLVIDQTPLHEPAVASTLRRLSDARQIRWLRLPWPSITRAMNVGLAEATRSLVLFLDDDIVPAPNLIEGHASAFLDGRVWAVAGQVLQPHQSPGPPGQYETAGFGAFLDFPFNSDETAWVQNGMAGNLSVRRDAALAIGGFDENFRGVAYRFETEFCRRLCAHGGRIRFAPEASILHLRHPTGGTRSRGTHLTSASPAHGVGDYYFALRQWPLSGSLAYALRRPFREVTTRFHLRRPWWIPIKLAGEILALVWGLWLAIRGPRYDTNPVR